MGQRSINKYVTLFFIFISLGRVFWKKLKEARSEGSEGGADVTVEEWVDISFAVQEELANQLPEMDVIFALAPKNSPPEE